MEQNSASTAKDNSAQKQKIGLSWIIPAYNEEERIEKTVREVNAYLQKKNFADGFEIIVSNSSSRDRTAEIVNKIRFEIKNLHLLNLENKGKGWAVKQGMLKAKGGIRVFADADNSVSVGQADNFIPLVCAGEKDGCFDIVIGSIEVPGAKIEEHAQWWRRMLGKTAKYVIRAVSGLWNVHDSQRGFKFFSARAADVIFPRQTLAGWGFDFEVLLIGKRNGFSIKEIPVAWVNPAGSKVGLGAYVSTLFELLRIKRNDIKGTYNK